VKDLLHFSKTISTSLTGLYLRSQCLYLPEPLGPYININTTHTFLTAALKHILLRIAPEHQALPEQNHCIPCNCLIIASWRREEHSFQETGGAVCADKGSQEAVPQ